MLHSGFHSTGSGQTDPNAAATEGVEAAKVAKLRQGVDIFNSQHAGPRSFKQCFQDAPLLLRRLWHDLTSFDGRIWAELLRTAFLTYHAITLLGFVAYIFSPVDFIPAAIHGLTGYLDDMIAALFMIVYITAVYRVVLVGIARARAGLRV